MNARHMARIAGFIVLLIGGLAAVSVLDYIQYLHWEMPVFAAHSSRTEAGMSDQFNDAEGRPRDPMF